MTYSHAVCYPDYFWKEARDNIEGDWYLMCPREILTVKDYALEDYFGEEWEERRRHGHVGLRPRIPGSQKREFLPKDE